MHYPQINSVDITFVPPTAGYPNNMDLVPITWDENNGLYELMTEESFWTILISDEQGVWPSTDFGYFEGGNSYYFEVMACSDNAVFTQDTVFTATDSNGNCAQVSSEYVDEHTVYFRVGYNLSTTLEILRQPNDYYGAEGSRASTTVEAKGDGLSYEWYAKDPGATKFSKSSSAVTKTYSVTLTAARNGRQLYCVVSDTYGNTETTDIVTLKISEELEISAQPDNYYGPLGSKASATVEAKGDGLTYAWYIKDPGATKFSKSSTAVTKTYSVNLTAARNGRQLYCVVSDVHGNSVTTDVVSLNVSTELELVTPPESYYGPEGSRASTTVEARGDGLTYAWYVKDPGATKFTKSNTAVTKTYSVNLTAARNGRQLYCVISDVHGNTLTTDVVSFNISTELEIVSQPVDYYGPAGSKASTTVEARGSGLTYEWYVKDPGATKFTKSSTAVTKTYSVNLTAARNGRQLYCVVSDAYGNSETTDTVTLNIHEELRIVSQPVNYYGPVGSKASATVEAKGDGLTYAWYVKDPGATKFKLSGTAVTKTYSVNLTAARNGRQLYCVVSDVHGNTVTTSTVSLNVG